MNPDLRNALMEKLVTLADDELILGHRHSEWRGQVPIIEEDIAFSNIALEEISHALAWYALIADLAGYDRDTYPNRLTYHRHVSAFRCAPFVEMPRTSWAFSILRQYLFDMAEKIYLDWLRESLYAPLAEAAVRIRVEETHHLRYSTARVRHLGLHSSEMNQQLQTALNALWPHALLLFEPLEQDAVLVAHGLIPDNRDVRQVWVDQVIPFLSETGLEVPDPLEPPMINRHQHSEHLEPLLMQMQQIARRYPDAGW